LTDKVRKKEAALDSQMSQKDQEIQAKEEAHIREVARLSKVIEAQNRELESKDQESERIKIQKSLDERLGELSQLREYGAALLNEGLNAPSLEAIAVWWDKVSGWKADVEAVMQQIHVADPKNWSTLGTFEYRFPKMNSNINHKASMLATLLEKLEKYINDHTTQ
jgi:hypothetical protein